MIPDAKFWHFLSSEGPESDVTLNNPFAGNVRGLPSEATSAMAAWTPADRAGKGGGVWMHQCPR
jgi:hypothetical protein